MTARQQATSRAVASRGTATLCLLAIAALPFLCKGAVVAVGLTGYLWQSLYKVFQLAGPVGWRRQQGRSWLASFWTVDQPLPDRRTWAMAVVLAAVLASSAIAAASMLAPRLDLQPESIRADLDARFAMTPLRAVLVVLYLLSINAALEELHFRAWLDGELSSRWGDAVGIIVSALAFAAMHVFIFAGGAGASPTALVLIFLALAVAGTCWSLLARRRGGIHAAWFSHGLTDATLLTWGLFWLGYF